MREFLFYLVDIQLLKETLESKSVLKTNTGMNKKKTEENEFEQRAKSRVQVNTIQ